MYEYVSYENGAPLQEYAEEAEQVTPEQRLWLAVVGTYLNDIRHAMTPIECRRLRNWLYTDMFMAVCEFAGLDPDCIRRSALEKIHRRREWVLFN